MPSFLSTGTDTPYGDKTHSSIGNRILPPLAFRFLVSPGGAMPSLLSTAPPSPAFHRHTHAHPHPSTLKLPILSFLYSYFFTHPHEPNLVLRPPPGRLLPATVAA